VVLVDGQPRDPKSLLQEWTQARGLNPPVYETINETGPDHEKVFEVKVIVKENVSGRGKGNSKREASKKAAKEALDQISRNTNNQAMGN
jgi:ribonuclease-3